LYYSAYVDYASYISIMEHTVFAVVTRDGTR